MHVSVKSPQMPVVSHPTWMLGKELRSSKQRSQKYLTLCDFVNMDYPELVNL